MSRRNKHRFAAQEMLFLLAQLAHNLLIWTRNDLAANHPRFRKYGIQRTVRDVLQIPGALQNRLGNHRQSQVQFQASSGCHFSTILFFPHLLLCVGYGSKNIPTTYGNRTSNASKGCPRRVVLRLSQLKR